MPDRYYLSAKLGSQRVEREVTLEEFCRAERAAGFRPKLPSSDPRYMTTPATGGFSSAEGISGHVRWEPAPGVPASDTHDCKQYADSKGKCMACGRAVAHGVPVVQPQQVRKCLYCERDMIAGSECLSNAQSENCDMRALGVEDRPATFPEGSGPMTVERLMELVRTLPPRSMRRERNAYLVEIELIAATLRDGVKGPAPMHPDCTAPDCDCEPGIECAARGAAHGVEVRNDSV